VRETEWHIVIRLSALFYGVQLCFAEGLFMSRCFIRLVEGNFKRIRDGYD